MKRILITALLCAALYAQTPGTITVTQIVTAVSGTNGTAVSCTFSNQAKPAIHTVCTIGGVAALSMDATPAIGAASGAVGSLTVSGNAVTWIITQPTAGVITWQIAANGTTQSGSF